LDSGGQERSVEREESQISHSDARTKLREQFRRKFHIVHRAPAAAAACPTHTAEGDTTLSLEAEWPARVSDYLKGAGYDVKTGVGECDRTRSDNRSTARCGAPMTGFRYNGHANSTSGSVGNEHSCRSGDTEPRATRESRAGRGRSVQHMQQQTRVPPITLPNPRQKPQDACNLYGEKLFQLCRIWRLLLLPSRRRWSPFGGSRAAKRV
jgi:hypothetical protein